MHTNTQSTQQICYNGTPQATEIMSNDCIHLHNPLHDVGNTCTRSPSLGQQSNEQHQQSRDARSLPPIHMIDAPVDRQSELKVSSWRMGERVVHARVENASAP